MTSATAAQTISSTAISHLDFPSRIAISAAALAGAQRDAAESSQAV